MQVSVWAAETFRGRGREPWIIAEGSELWVLLSYFRGNVLTCSGGGVARACVVAGGG